MKSDKTTCVIVNKDGSILGPSETFLVAHIEGIPGQTLSLIGNPLQRRTGSGSRDFINSQSLVARAARALPRRAGVDSVSAQDRRSLTRHLAKNRVDVVLAEYGPTALSVLDACEAAGIPMVTHFHGWDAYVLAPREETRAEYARVFTVSEAIIAVSRHMKQHLEGLGAPGEKVVWNPCGADVPETRTGAPENAPPTYMAIGRETPKKAAIVALMAFARVRQALPDAGMEFVGFHAEGPLLQAVRALDLDDSVSFLGPLPHEEVLKRFAGVRCYVHPSVTAPDGDMEGTPVSVMEAMAAGVPVVATRHGGIADLLEGTSAGILVEEYDVESTAQAMIAYGRDPERAARDGDEGRDLMKKHWSMDHSVERLGQVVQLAASRDSKGIAEMAEADSHSGFRT